MNVIVPNAFPDFLRWMSGAKDIIRYDKYKEFADKLIAEADVICCLDFNELSRIDAMAAGVDAASRQSPTSRRRTGKPRRVGQALLDRAVHEKLGRLGERSRAQLVDHAHPHPKKE